MWNFIEHYAILKKKTTPRTGKSLTEVSRRVLGNIMDNDMG